MRETEGPSSKPPPFLGLATPSEFPTSCFSSPSRAQGPFLASQPLAPPEKQERGPPLRNWDRNLI